MATKTISFEPERYIKTEAAQRHLLELAFESGDVDHVIDCIGIVARARGISEVANSTGLSRQALYAAFGPKGNPTISTVMKVLHALGLTLEVKQAA